MVEMYAILLIFSIIWSQTARYWTNRAGTIHWLVSIKMIFDRDLLGDLVMVTHIIINMIASPV
jgi:hypothetical protein